jgi:outer membrane protein OmpA-like peptidoglycan-associated protein
MVDTPFSFKASASAFTSQGDSSGVAWYSQADQLKTWLADGGNWQLQGDAYNVTLTGTVESESIKQAKTSELQMLLGAETTVTNLLTVPPSLVVIPEPPTLAKLYFNTGKSSLPSDATSALEPTIEWLISHPESKAIISGYHDARGNQVSNQKLAKERAQATMDALLEAGVDASRIEMRKPVETEGTGNEEEARRVEVAIE